MCDATHGVVGLRRLSECGEQGVEAFGCDFGLLFGRLFGRLVVHLLEPTRGHRKRSCPNHLTSPCDAVRLVLSTRYQPEGKIMNNITAVTIAAGHDDALRVALIGPRYTDAYTAAEDAEDWDTVTTLDDAQTALDDTYEQVWQREVHAVAAEMGIEVTIDEHHTSSGADEFEVACSIAQAAHDRIHVDEDTWTVQA